MHRDVQIIGPEESLRNAAAMMKRLDAVVLPVSANDKLVGMITDRDIAIRGIAEGKGPDARVRNVMSHEVKYCFEDEELAHVMENMAELQVRRLPAMRRSLCPSSSSVWKPLEVGLPARCDTGDLFAQSRQPPVPVAGRRHGFGEERLGQPARRGGCRP
jgi:predicted transcriptional regulator